MTGSVQEGKGDRAAAYTYCFIFTLASALPWAFLLITALFMVVSLLKVPFVVVAAWAQFWVQGLSYTHTD